MSTDTTYNGWRNVETWRVQLHLANDETESRAALNTAMAYELGTFPITVGVCVDADTGQVRHDGGPFRGSYVEFLRDRVERRVEHAYRETSGPRPAWEMFARDVVEAALARVDWEQIADHWLEAARHELKQGATE